ncbi:MAG: helix-turn-helix domain-containing protein [Lentisphaeria bacterium]|nr:helix-turn-helix domain-containing protein [Lentisphaeria bacterium]
MAEENAIADSTSLTLAEKIDLLEKQLNIHLTIHDLRGLLTLDMRDHILPGRRWHRCPYCWEGRFGNELWGVDCTIDCMRQPHRRCQLDPSPYWKKCWKGVWELVVPIARNGQSMLLLFAGVFRDEKPLMPPEVKALPEFHRNYYRDLPLKKSVNTLQLITMLEFFGNALLFELEKAGSIKDISRRNMSEIIKRFILQNASQDITLGDLAKYLSLSKSRAGHAVKQYCGKSFGELLREERLNRAVNLLTTAPQISIRELALSVGYNDSAYFMRLFSRKFGMGPRAYQQKLQKG